MAANLSISCSCPKEHIVPNQIVSPPNPKWYRPLSEDLIELFHKAIDNENKEKLEDWQEWWVSMPVVIDQWEEMNKKIINSKDQNGFTALHKACGQGDLDMVKYLLENDAEMNTTDENFGQTPLHMAAVQKHSEVVSYLMDHASSKV